VDNGKMMHQIIFHTIKIVVHKGDFISMSVDEITTKNNKSWLSVHLYVVEALKKVPILFNLQRVVDGGMQIQ
jgi:hypothetical protein